LFLCLRELTCGERVFLDREKMESCCRGGLLQKHIAGLQKVEPETKPGLNDDELPATSPSLGEAVPLQEYMPRLLRCACGSVIDVTVLFRPRNLVSIQNEAGRGDDGHFSTLIASCA
jgi:hypothetical protein